MQSSALSDFGDRLRRAYERLNSGDPRPMAECLDDDVIYHLPGKHLGGGTLRGRGEVLERMAERAPDFDTPPRIRLLSVVASEEFVVSFERFTARRRGRSLDQEVCVVWRVAGARCAEIWSHFSDQHGCDLFWHDV